MRKGAITYENIEGNVHFEWFNVTPSSFIHVRLDVRRKL